MTQVIGFAATFSAIIIFCGSVWLLLALVLGGRLAYYVTASVTLGFLLIMSLVWSVGEPLGPVGVPPDWSEVAIGEDASKLNFAEADSYPDAPWVVPDEDDDTQQKQSGELEGAATDYLDAQIKQNKTAYDAAGDAQVKEDSTRLLEKDGKTYGALVLEPLKEKTGDSLVVVMSYDPGNPNGKARLIALGTFILLALHLFLLSRSEKAAARRREAATA